MDRDSDREINREILKHFSRIDNAEATFSTASLIAEKMGEMMKLFKLCYSYSLELDFSGITKGLEIGCN